MNGRSGKNNVEIKSRQQVCVFLFFLFLFPSLSLFFISLGVHFAMTEEELWEEREISLNEGAEGLHGPRALSQVSIWIKDKSKTPPLTSPPPMFRLAFQAFHSQPKVSAPGPMHDIGHSLSQRKTGSKWKTLFQSQELLYISSLILKVSKYFVILPSNPLYFLPPEQHFQCGI